MEPKFRLAKIEDASKIAVILMTSYNITSLDEGVHTFLSEMKKNVFVLAEQDNTIVGVASYKIHGLPKHELAEMDRIAILPEYRGKGISKPLFEYLLKDVKKFYEKQDHKLRKLFLLTHAENKRAHEFYKKLGFSHETTLKNHYYEGKDEFVFSMFL